MPRRRTSAVAAETAVGPAQRLPDALRACSRSATTTGSRTARDSGRSRSMAKAPRPLHPIDRGRPARAPQAVKDGPHPRHHGYRGTERQSRLGQEGDDDAAARAVCVDLASGGEWNIRGQHHRPRIRDQRSERDGGDRRQALVPVTDTYGVEGGAQPGRRSRPCRGCRRRPDLASAGDSVDHRSLALRGLHRRLRVDGRFVSGISIGTSGSGYNGSIRLAPRAHSAHSMRPSTTMRRHTGRCPVSSRIARTARTLAPEGSTRRRYAATSGADAPIDGANRR